MPVDTSDHAGKNNPMEAPAYTRNFWAKSDRRNPQRIHLLGTTLPP